MMNERYQKNLATFTEEEVEKFRDFRVCIAGCGALGGHVIEHLARIGIGHLTVVDGDTVETSNLNRQLLTTEKNIGMPKTEAATQRLWEVNSTVNVHPVQEYITEENARRIIGGHDVIVDAFDNAEARLILEKAAEEEGIPMVHGAVAGWNGRISIVQPGSKTIDKIIEKVGRMKDVGNPSFTPAVVAAIQSTECVKLLIGRPTLVNKLMQVDLLNQKYEVIDID